jgi:uracil DNA glycosylase superfamily protein
VKNPNLAALNFSSLLHYEAGAPTPEGRYAEPLRCTGFCTACEDAGLLSDASFRLSQLSHGCDTQDHERVLGSPVPPAAWGHIDVPILFLLESPGGQAHNGKRLCYRGVEKIPPVKSYYYAPDPEVGWAISPRDKYGPYFSYIMGKFGLRNVYITNAVKCGKVGASGGFEPFTGGADPTEARIRLKCWEQFLSREIELHNPALVFAFGWNAYRCCELIRRVHQVLPVHRLLHPSARRSRDRIRSANDESIVGALRSIGAIRTV